MPKPTLSTNDLAKLLNINVSTVKRWADSGQLQCIRTPGGHRRFRIDDVYAFLSAKGYDPHSLRPLMRANESISQLDEAVLHRNWSWMRDKVAAVALEGQTRELVKVFVATHLAGITPAELADLVILPAAEQVSGRWTTSGYSVADQRLVEHVVSNAVAEMRSHWQPQAQTPYVAVVGAFSPDTDDILAQMAAQSLVSEGWRMFPYGADLPADAFVGCVEQREPDVVVVTATILEDLDQFRGNCARMAETAVSIDAAMVCTGRAFSAIDVRCEHDITVARGLADMVSFLRERFRARPGDARRGTGGAQPGRGDGGGSGSGNGTDG